MGNWRGPLLDGYLGGSLPNPLARVQETKEMTPQEALDFLDGARFENYSGQIIAEHANKNKDFILCDLGCTCSEVGSKNADEYGEVLITLLNGTSAALSDLAAYQRIVSDALDGVQAELQAGAIFENVMLAVASRVALAWMEEKGNG